MSPLQRSLFQWAIPTTLRARLLLLVVLAALPALASIIASALHERSNAMEMAMTKALSQTRLVLAEQGEVKAAARELLGSIAILPEITHGGGKACARTLPKLLRASEMFANLGKLDAKGMLICSVVQPRDQRVIDSSGRTYFKRALKSKSFAAGDFQIGSVTRSASINYALPVYADGELTSVLIANYPLSKMLDPLRNAHLPQGTRVTLLDPGFTVVAQDPPDASIGKSIVGTEMHRFIGKELAKSDRSHSGMAWVVDQRILAFTALRADSGETQGYVVVNMPKAAILAPANRALGRDLAYITLVLLVISGIALIGSEVLVLNRIRALLSATRRIAAGDLGARVPETENKCELSDLDTAFNNMADRVEAQISSIQSLNRTYAMLTAINSALIHIRNRDELLNEACRIAVTDGAYISACVFVVDQGATQTRLAAHAGLNRALFESIKVDLTKPLATGRGPVATSISTGAHVVVHNIGEETSAGWSVNVHNFGARSMAAYPLLINGEVRGSLAFWSSDAQAFDDDEVLLLKQLAADTSIGLEHIDKEAKISRLTRVQAVLTEINSALLRMQKTEDMSNEACRIAVDTGGFLTACIVMTNEDATQFRIAGHAGAGRDYFDSLSSNVVDALQHANTPLLRALQTGGHAIEQDFELLDNHPFKLMLLELGVRAVAALPLRITGQFAGVLVLWSSTSHAFDDAEILLLQQLAADTGLGLEIIGQQAQVYQLSNFDRLTGLPNRSLFEDRAAQILSRAPHLQRVVTVLVIRVGRFRQINDQYGRAGSDRVLMQVARYLSEALRPGDTAARLGDDEFGLLLADVNSVEDAIATADRILSGFPRTIEWEGDAVPTASNMGIAISPQDGMDVATLLQHASLALNNLTLSNHGTFAFYSPKLDLQAHERRHMEIELAGALDRDELFLVYQPIVNISDGTIVGAEALLRWHHRALGQVSPAVFVPLAERTGLIERIGAWVFESACTQLVAWKPVMADDFRLSVNVSTHQLRVPDFLGQVNKHLETTGLDPRQSLLCIEITESELMENMSQAVHVLNRLKTMGFQISIDDFGTGYSSLSYIRRLPVDTLKIDISFVRDIATDANAKALAASIVALGHNLNLAIVAEGIETETQLNILAEMGCDKAQGYLFSRPVPATEFEKLALRLSAPSPKRAAPTDRR